jgi:hypothetical protein
VYGFSPTIGSVVDFWKKSGTISTSPPMAMVTRISTIISRLLVSTFSWVKPVLRAGRRVGLEDMIFLCVLHAWARAIGGIATRTERPDPTVIQTFQAITNMPLRYNSPPMRRTT